MSPSSARVPRALARRMRSRIPASRPSCWRRATGSADAAQGGSESAWSNFLEPGNRWNPMIDAISTYVNGSELDQVSILDTEAYEDTEINWRVRRGYGALMAAYGASLPLALNCQVSLIDHSGQRLR